MRDNQKDYFFQSDSLEEIAKRKELLEEYGGIAHISIKGSIDIDTVTNDLLIQSPEEVMEMARKNNIGTSSIIEAATEQLEGDLFHVPDPDSLGLSDYEKEEITNHLSESLRELSQNASESDSSVDQGQSSETEQESPEGQSESSQEKTGKTPKAKTRLRGISKDWDGVDKGKRLNSAIEFFEENAGKWLDGEDFALWENDLDPESAQDRGTASRALLNVMRRKDELEIEKREADTDRRGGPKSEFRYAGNSEDAGTIPSMSQSSHQFEVLEYLVEAIEPGEKIDVSTVRENVDLEEQQTRNALSALKCYRDFVRNPERGKWTIDEEAIRIVEYYKG